MSKRLADRTAIVTGAARGMGYAISRALLREGAKVAIVDIDEDAVKKAARRLDPEATSVIGRSVDVSNKSQVTECVREVTSICPQSDFTSRTHSVT